MITPITTTDDFHLAVKYNLCKAQLWLTILSNDSRLNFYVEKDVALDQVHSLSKKSMHPKRKIIQQY